MITIQQQPVQWAIMQPVAFGQGGGVFVIPPVSENLLVWLAWEDAAPTQTDKWTQPNAENMVNTSGDLYAFEETSLGTMEVADTITLPFEVPDDGAHSNDGTCTVTLDTATNVLTCTVAGTIRNIEITGTVISDQGIPLLNPDGTPMLNPDGTPMYGPTQ